MSIADTLGFAGFLAINVVYMSEIMGPTVRPRIMMISQVAAIFVLLVILTGIIPHYWFPSQYRLYLWLLAGLNILVAIALYFRMPESPRSLEARERRDQARTVMEKMEARVSKGGRVALPEPDLAPHQVVAEEKTKWLAPFGRNYLFITILLLVVMALGYGGIIYGGASQSFLFLSLSRGYSAGFVFALVSWSGVVSSAIYLLNAFFGDRFERRWVQLFGAILFAGGGGRLRDSRHRGHGHHVPHCGRRRDLVAVEHVRLHPLYSPTGCGRWAPAGPMASATSAPGAVS